ncbi:MAG TPA: hypothetical protein VGD01_15670 [Candidatus Elarobacter sp.]|jgi:hypothetical protein
MMQTQWPGLGPTIDLSSLDVAAGDGRRMWPGDGAIGSAAAPQSADAVARPWWSCGTGSVNAGNALGALLGGGGGGAASGAGGALFGLLSGLANLLQQLVGSLLNQAGSGSPYGTGQQTPTGAQQCAPGGARPGGTGGAQQRFSDVDISSTGDPHIGEVGTRDDVSGAHAVDAHWDSMTSHDDLVHSDQIPGGYRVSTAVTPAGANGVTTNQSATVHTNFGQDAITMNRDGSFAIFDDGEALELGAGESATLSGGERVKANQDGSLSVTARTRGGGSIATTLRATGAGVDVTTHAHELSLGGDAIAHDTPQTKPQPPVTPVRNGHPHHARAARHPVAPEQL